MFAADHLGFHSTVGAAVNAGRRLEKDEHIPCPESLSTDHTAMSLLAAWDRELATAKSENRRPKFLNAAWAEYKWGFFIAFVGRCLQESMAIVVTFLVREFVRWIDDNGEVPDSVPLWKGYLFAVCLSIAGSLSLTAMVCSGDVVQTQLQRLRAALVGITFIKATKLHTSDVAARQGLIASMHGSDTAKLKDMPFLMAAVTAPFFLLLYCVTLSIIAGWPGITVAGVVLLVWVSQFSVGSRLAPIRHKYSKATDDRLQRLCEMLGAIRTCKFMSWEPTFLAAISKARAREMSHLKRMFSLRVIVISLSHALPLLAETLLFALVYVKDGTVTAEVVFPSITILVAFRPLLTVAVLGLSKLADVVVILRRYENLMLLEAPEPYVLRVQEGGASPSTSTSNPSNSTQKTAATNEPFDGENRLVNTDQRNAEITRCDGYMTSAAAPLGFTVGVDALQVPSACNFGFLRPTAAVSMSPSPSQSSPSQSSPKPVSGSDPTASTTAVVIRQDQGSDLVSELQKKTGGADGDQLTATVPCVDAAGCDAEFQPLVTVPAMTIAKGSLTLVVGATASGKSTLLTALLGEGIVDPSLMCPGDLAGTLKRSFGRDVSADPAEQQEEMRAHSLVVQGPGGVAYVPQEPWAMNATMRENVLLTSAYDDDRYIAALAACKLADDIDHFADGDRTEIGEHGINLSGGQKQRVALARAAYSDKSLILMDDPLSAVDPHVAQALFHDCICGPMMADRTRVLVTHQVQFLPFAERVVVTDNGLVVFDGSFEKLAADPILGPQYTTTGDKGDAKTGSASKKKSGPKSKKPESGRGQSRASSGPSAALSQEMVKAKQVLVEKEKRRNEVAGRLIQDEIVETGSVDWRVYKWVLSRAGPCLVTGAFTFYLLWRVSLLFADMWLSFWSSKAKPFGVGEELTDEQYMGYFGLIAALCILSIAIRQCVYMYAGTVVSGNAHDLLVANVVRAPLSYFDTTPLGRILNRFSKDIETMDTSLPEETNFMFNGLFQVSGLLVLIAIAAPVLLPLMLLLVVLFGLIVQRLAGGLRLLRREENAARSPVMGMMSQTLGGLASLRGYGVVQVFSMAHSATNDFVISTAMGYRSILVYLMMLVALLGCFLTLPLNIFIVNAVKYESVGKLLPGGNTASLAAAYGAILPVLASYLLLGLSTCSGHMNSVERVFEYCEELPQEQTTVVAPTDEERQLADGWAVTDGFHEINPSSNTQKTSASISKSLPVSKNAGGKNGAELPSLQEWPTSGALKFHNVKLRYRPGLPLVLKGLSFAVKSGEKVGIVGRTGSGKSTLMLALFRMVELAGAMAELEGATSDETTVATDVVTEESTKEGSGAVTDPAEQDLEGGIFFAGRNIGGVPLPQLRSAITIIPQDPVLFAGSVRRNLDPAGVVPDEEIWAAIDRVHMRDRLTEGVAAQPTASSEFAPDTTGTVAKDSVSSKPASPAPQSESSTSGLDTVVAEKGSNFSVGQRQLLCLARALLKKSKVLLLDEATASVDFEADQMIQQTIREAFAECTVLTIAHRLATVVDADKVLVLGGGRVVEFAPPAHLLKNANSALHGMAKQLGTAQFDALTMQAVAAFERSAAVAQAAVVEEAEARAGHLVDAIDGLDGIDEV